MTAAAQKQVVEKALALPKKARESLAQKLWESLEPVEEKLSREEWTGEWKTELGKRIAEIESGKVKCIPHEEVRQRLDKLLRKA